MKAPQASCHIHVMTQASEDRVDQSLIALRRILRATTLHERELATSAGVTPAQLRVLQIVHGHPDGSTTPKALATRMGVTQATVTSLIDKLQKAGLVARRPSEVDRRQTNIFATEKGSSVVQDVPDALQQRFVKAFEMIEDWEQAQLLASLERVAAMLDAADIDASPVLTTGEIDMDRSAHG